jgi:hypothetical protein
MRGTITSWDIVRHPVLILRGFGPVCYLRCILAVVSRRQTTFLESSVHHSLRSR